MLNVVNRRLTVNVTPSKIVVKVTVNKAGVRVVVVRRGRFYADFSGGCVRVFTFNNATIVTPPIDALRSWATLYECVQSAQRWSDNVVEDADVYVALVDAYLDFNGL